MYLQGRIEDFWKGCSYVQRHGIRFADYISFFLNNPWKWNNLVSLRANYFISIRYLKTGGGGVRANVLNPLWMIKKRYRRSCLNSMSVQYLLCIRRIFNYCVPAILACTSCEHLMRFHWSLTWAWWNIDAKKIIILDAETWNLPTRKLQQVNTYGTRNNFTKRYSAAFQLWNIFSGTCFLHLQTGEMPSCVISTEYELFV